MDIINTKGNAKLKIAVAEDSPTQSEQLKYILESNGYEVMVSRNGKEAIDQILSNTPDIVISDIIMPEMDGYELCKQIKSNDTLRDVPVILLTSLADPADVIKGLECGADNFITKPYDKDSLLSRINYLRLNWQLPETSQVRMGVEVTFGGKKYMVTSDRLQILNLLLSTYESAVGKNRELEQTQNELRLLNEQLEQRVKQRTADLTEANEKLKIEVTNRQRAQEHISHLNSVLLALRGINQLISHEPEREYLIRQSCDLMVDTRGFLSAWILLFDTELRYISSAVSGDNCMPEYQDCLQTGDYPPCIKKILAHDDSLAICAELIEDEVKCLPGSMTERSSNLVSRLEYGDKVFGVIGMHTQPDFSFDPEEQSLFRELTADISYALYNIEREEEQKKTGEALTRTEEKLRITIDSVPQGIIVADMNGNVTQTNKPALQMLGYESETELIGYNQTICAAIEDHNLLNETINRAIHQNSQPFCNYTAVRKDGSAFNAEMVIAIIRDNADSPIGIIEVFEDITEKKQLQEQLMVTDRLASVGELAAGIAHELNNPLTGVIGFSELLMTREDLDDEIKDDLGTINREAIRASQVARNLLTFSRRHPNEKKEVDVNDVIKLVLDLRSYEHKVNNIEVDLLLQDGMSAVMANDFQLQQVFLNIIINAEFFMIKEAGCGKLKIRTKQSNGVITASISDNGPGISQENLGHIFDPFYTTKEVGKGTGLGLSICYGLITEHGGTIRAESNEGQGATFIVELPVNENFGET